VILNTILPPAVEVLNRGIRERPDASLLCEQLAGRSLVTRIEGLPTGSLAIRLSASAAAIEIIAAADVGEADAVIAGTPLELRRLMFVDRDAPIRAGRVLFDGDIEVAEKFRALLMAAMPDLENRLAEWVGEPAAFQLTNLALDLRDWMRDSVEDLVERTSEYLQDDARRVPPHEEVNEFCAAVDDLTNDVDRLEARLARLDKREPLR
jgi:ubiquinone biosynthesis protein UbiJ